MPGNTGGHVAGASAAYENQALHEAIRNDDFSATQRGDIVPTLFRMVTTLLQHCNVLLRQKSSLRIVTRNITFNHSFLLKAKNRQQCQL